ncbi:MAG: DUF3617 family protein [Pseudomonadota bacterium]
MAFPSRTTGPLFLTATLIAGLCSQALALDMPKRKSGLWEITTSMEGMPKGMGAIQHCIDQNSDNLMQQDAEKFKQQCSATDVKQQGDRITIHSVCKMETTKNVFTTTTMDAVFTGAFDSAYRGDIKTRFNPPLHGMVESRMGIAAKWVGACKPGQKPGDIVMPGRAGNFNLEEAMKKHNATKP